MHTRRALLGLCLCSGLGAESPAGARSGIGRPFALVDVDGHSVTDRDLRGRWLVVVFGYTFCQDVCPTTLGEIAAAMEKLGPLSKQVQPIFVSIDPERDTPEVLRDFVGAFGAEIMGLTGTESQVIAAAETFDVLFYKVAGHTPADYTVAHSAHITVIGPEGGLVTRFSADADADRIAATLRKLMQ
jgi:protein SCO1/2